MNTLIRSANKADIDILNAISRRTVSKKYRPFLGDKAVDGFLGSGAADKYIEDNIEHCFAILAENKVVGFCVYEESLIALLMIDHPYHRKGLGGQLLTHCEQILFKIYNKLTLESFEQNHQANNFYKKHGWTAGEIYFDSGPGANKIVFTKRA